MKKLFLVIAALLVLSFAYSNANADDYSCTDAHENCGVGPQGEKGDKGDRGPRGYSGKDGKDGAPGQAGKDGAPGQHGRDGAPGLNGKNGATGLTGLTGPQGATGLTGATGASGISEEMYTDLLNDNRLVETRLIGGLSALAAGANIPDAEDGKTGIGIGFSNYRGVEGLAIGIVHNVEDLKLRATLATSSAERDAVIGLGATVSF